MKIEFLTAYKLSRKESISLTFHSATRCSVWKILWISPFWVSWTFIALLKNHVLKNVLALFHFQHLKNKPWLSEYMLLETYFIYLFLRQWHASRPLGLTSFPVQDSTFQTNPSNSVFDSSIRTEEISIIYCLKYWAILRNTLNQ